MYRPLKQAPEGSVNLVVREATQDDRTKMDYDNVSGGYFVRTNPVIGDGQAVVDLNFSGASAEELTAHELVHAAGAYNRQAKTGVPTACEGDHSDCVTKLTNQIMREVQESEAKKKQQEQKKL